jgi:hypothetical protein
VDIGGAGSVEPAARITIAELIAAIPHEYARQAWLALIWAAFDGRSRFAFDFP